MPGADGLWRRALDQNRQGDLGGPDTGSNSGRPGKPARHLPPLGKNTKRKKYGTVPVPAPQGRDATRKRVFATWLAGARDPLAWASRPQAHEPRGQEERLNAL